MARSRSRPLFIADAVALDFLNSTVRIDGSDLDWLDSGAGLLEWLQHARLAPAAALSAVRAGFTTAELDDIAAKAQALREWFRTFVLERKGQPLTEKDFVTLECLNRLLERDETYSQLAQSNPRDNSLSLQVQRRWESAESLLIVVAQMLAVFVCEQDLSSVKLCDGPGCTLIFADNTRGRARRWCRMTACGSRARRAPRRST